MTTIRDPGCMNGVAWCLEERARSAANKTVAPRIYAYVAAVRSAAPTGGADGDDAGYPAPAAPDDFRKLVTWSKQKGIDGFKVLALDPDLMRALLDESKKQGLGVAAHLSQMMVARFNAVQAAEAGLTTLEHWYGLPESLFDDRTIQDYPADYNYQDERIASARRVACGSRPRSRARRSGMR